jgi:hypothetical protein
MSTLTEELHTAFLSPLAGTVVWHSPVGEKPLSIDLALPRPPRLRVYLYSLVDSVATVRHHEYKAVLRVPGQAIGTYESFDYSGGRLVLLVGYRADLDVFVLWDASLHPRFKNGGNIQIRDATVLEAAATGRSLQVRKLANKVHEVVIACQSWTLGDAVNDRVIWTGSSVEETWLS